MSWVQKYHPQAVLYVWQGGQEGGNGVADVLTGKACACGKLTDTIAADINDYPSTENFGDPFKNYYKEDIYVGYRYFDTFGIMPLYCFGYGKGYTDFSLVTKEVTADEKLVKVEVEVTNIGKVYPGREVVQVYYSAPDGVMEKPTQELAGFAKTKLLMPGEKEVVTVTFATEDMASYDSYDAAWVMEEGEYTIRVGNSSRTTEVAAIIDLDETVQTVLLKNVMKDKEFVKEIHHMVPIFDLELDDTPFMRPILIYAENFKKKIMEYEVLRTTLEDKRPDEILTLEDVKKGAASLEELVAQLTVEEKAFFRRKHMGMIFQDFQLLESLTVKENILLPLILERKEADIQQERFSRIADVLGIEKLADKGITEISGGQKQRVGIGRALINEPDIIFGDEPTGSLDRKTTGDVMRCMKQMNQRSGISFLLVTHDAYTASFCDRVLFLQDGNLAKEVKKENTADNFREDIWKTLCGLGGGKDDLF